jgi:hypothetical protein
MPREHWGAAAPPIDHVPVDPPYRGIHPIKRGLAAVLIVIGVVAVSPLIILGVLIWLWWEALKWATN